MPRNVVTFNTLRARSYLSRIPFFTRAVITIIALLWVLGLQSVWDVRRWGALTPSQMSLGSAYRINTFPFIHLNFVHALLNILALTPLMERFESEHGTLTSVAMFIGPLTTIPALLYVFLESVIFRTNHSVMGASIWVFLLLGLEAIRTYRANPSLTIATYHVPTWTMPLVMVLFVAALVPSTSLLGHLCGLGVGYLFGLGYLKVLSPPERILRWIETRLNLLARLPHYVSVDQKTYGRFGVLPSSNHTADRSQPTTLVGTTQRLGP